MSENKLVCPICGQRIVLHTADVCQIAQLEAANSRLRSRNTQLIMAGNEMEFALVRLACGGIAVVAAWRELVNGEK